MTNEKLLEALKTELTVPLWPHAGMALGLSKNPAYDAAKRGDIPTIRVGRVWRVPTAALRKMLGIETPVVTQGSLRGSTSLAA